MNKLEINEPRAARLRTLLYVEDNPASLKIVEQFIARDSAMRLLTAVNGNDGIAMARVSRPDVIIMDINLPDISGFKALATLRAHPATAHIPVIALSANAMALNVESGLEAGFFRYLTKPVKLHDLTDALDAALALAEKEVSVSR